MSPTAQMESSYIKAGSREPLHLTIPPMGPTLLEGLRRAVSIDKPLGNLGNGYKIQDKHRGICSSVKSH